MTNHIIITGTGRCGTTFLVRLFTLLELDTGFDKKTMISRVFSNCNSGLETHNLNSTSRIMKDPTLLDQIPRFSNDKLQRIEHVIIPIRNYDEAANSRAKHGNSTGGLCRNAKNAEEQKIADMKSMARYIHAMTMYDIPTTFIDFAKMTSNPEYLFNKLPLCIMKGITSQRFLNAYLEATNLSMPK